MSSSSKKERSRDESSKFYIDEERMESVTSRDEGLQGHRQRIRGLIGAAIK